MESISIGRFEEDPQAQGVIRPESDRWQLVIDKDGYPHLYVEVTIEERDGEPVKGMFCVEDMLPEGITTRVLMDEGSFGGALAPEDEEAAQQAYLEGRARNKIPCPRP